jgi:hypothetical protein
MLILSETIPPSPRRRILDDDGYDYSGQKKLQDENPWVVEQFTNLALSWSRLANQTDRYVEFLKTLPSKE